MPKTLLLISLWGALLLFVGRVIGQVFVGIYHPGWLPPWEEWHSGLLPYPALLICQILLIMLMTLAAYDLSRSGGWFFQTIRDKANGLRRFSVFYFLGMLLRYALTMAMHPERRWFTGTIPIWFHLVLATFLYLAVTVSRRPSGP